MESVESTTRLTIDVWADIVCPFCYLGEQRLAEAVEQSPHAASIDLKIHTFQLDPGATEVLPVRDYLTRRYGGSAGQILAMEENLAGQAAAEGLKYEVDRPMGNTADMLRLVKLGSEHGLGWEYLRAMQAELFGGNHDAFEHSTLVRIGEGLGIPGDEIRDVLATDRYADAMQTDHETAVRLGGTGVPFTVLGGRLGVPGAVSTDQFGAAISQAWEHING